jgi:hypothetical protein
MRLLRCFLWGSVLLRLLIGAAWAMPTLPVPMPMSVPMSVSKAMPCHAMEMGTETGTETEEPDHTNVSSCSVLCHICCMGFADALVMRYIPTPIPRHVLPIHHAQEVARWQHTPDLRPPI